jgi:hypothetical protein
MDVVERVARLSQGAAQRLLVRSALNPMLWLAGVGAPVCFTFAYLFHDIEFARNLLLVVGTLPILFTCIGFCYFVLIKPEKLQSEDFQIRQQTLQIIQHKAGRINIDTSALESIANMAVRQIAKREGQS